MLYGSENKAKHTKQHQIEAGIHKTASNRGQDFDELLHPWCVQWKMLQ